MNQGEPGRGPDSPPTLKPTPAFIPPSLLRAFSELNAAPILVGGAAVQVWTGRTDGLFQTEDLDFITHLQASDFTRFPDFKREGRYIIVDGVAVEFPSGPLGVADVHLDAEKDTVAVPTSTGGMVRCIRPEALLLDRLAQVVGWNHADAYVQALAVLVMQGNTPGWDWAWLESASKNSRLSTALGYLRREWESGRPSPENLDEVLGLNWDSVKLRPPNG